MVCYISESLNSSLNEFVDSSQDLLWETIFLALNVQSQLIDVAIKSSLKPLEVSLIT